MQWTGLNELREKYLSFFEGKGHLRLDSFPLVPKDDPSLLLINSGMAPMKKWFLAQEEPPRHRVTTCQKCIRTPDIERVGITARHGTFFEMLGNFSFQDYFKEEVIPWAWEFLTSDEWMAIPKDKLHISVYEEDDEAYDIWTKKVGIAPDHMVRLGKEDNFWEHGSGPCGPCSEIYFDRGPEYGCGKPTCGVGCDCDRYMEIWNLVFSQFDADGKGHYERLARPNIDTGMGLERLACVMQGVGNLFEVDTVQSVLHHVEHIAGKTYGADAKDDISIRVITDHIRSCTFMVSDGILPSNEGRGYVLRRLLRRAARHGRMLGIRRPFLVELAETVIQSSESAYPELREHDAYIKKVIGTEEANFARTIDAGMTILNNMIDGLEKAHEHLLKGLDVFKLNDTFGFPLDLTKEIAAEQGIDIDEEGFHTEMKKQKERARAERLKKNISGWSEDLFGSLNTEPTVFTGYETLNDTGVVVALSDEETLTDAIATDEQAKEDVLVVLDKTPFYAEMGGQVADQGVLTSADCSLRVLDVKKTPKGYYVHTCVLESGIVKVGDHLTAKVDKEYRMAVCRNHTATHLLQAALREVLGDHVHQAGSYQDGEITHFDFTHFSAVTADELARVEKIVNDRIFDAMDVTVKEMPIDEAKKLGAMALFGEKYGHRRGRGAAQPQQGRARRRYRGLVHRVLRRYPCPEHRPDRLLQDRQRVLCGCRYPPHRGRDRQEPAAARQQAGNDAAHRGGCPQGQQCGRSARPRRGCHGREQGHEQGAGRHEGEDRCLQGHQPVRRRRGSGRREDRIRLLHRHLRRHPARHVRYRPRQGRQPCGGRSGRQGRG